MRNREPNCGDGFNVCNWCRVRLLAQPFLLVIMSFGLALIFVLGPPVFAKSPGEKHCYRDVCHRVKTAAETKALIGQTISLVASHYDSPLNDRFNRGVFTSSGTKFDAEDPTAAASSNFPDGTELLVWNPKNGRAAHIRVTDFGPFLGNRTLDLTRSAAATLDFAHDGIASLRVTVIAPPPSDEPNYLENRVYRKVGGFLGVYRTEELAPLASLLASQAELRRQRGRTVLVASAEPLKTGSLGPPSSGAVTPVRLESTGLEQAHLSTAIVAQEPPVSLNVDRYINPAETPDRKVAAPQKTSIAPDGEDAGRVLAPLRPKLKPDRRNVGDITSARAIKVAAVEVLPSKASVKSEHASSSRLRTPRTGLFLGDRARVVQVAGNAAPRFGAPRAGESAFPMFGGGGQGVGFLIVALLLTSSAFFAAYISVSRGVISADQLDPTPRRRVSETSQEFAQVDIVASNSSNRSKPAGTTLAIQAPAKALREIDEGDSFKGGDDINEATVIKDGSKIVGNLTTEGCVIVHGCVEGDCICDTLLMGLDGIVSGRVKASRAIIDGRVDGTVEVADLHIKGNACIKGTVSYHNLELDQGASLEAECKRTVSA